MPLTPASLVATTALARTRDDDDRRGWNLLSSAAGILAGVAARKVLTAVWESRTGVEPPENPADPTVSWKEALAWSAAIGVGVGVARTLGRRGAAAVYAKATDQRPPRRTSA